MSSTRQARRWRAAPAIVAALVAVLSLFGPRVDAAAQEGGPTSTSTAIDESPTSSDLLVPGDGTDGAESTTTTTVAPASAADDDGLSDSTLITLIIAGLVVVALLVGTLTWRYWLATRPVVRRRAHQ